MLPCKNACCPRGKTCCMRRLSGCFVRKRPKAPCKMFFLVQEIDYPSRDHIAQALASDRRLAAMAALDSVRHMYEGAHHHIIYQRL